MTTVITIYDDNVLVDGVPVKTAGKLVAPAAPAVAAPAVTTAPQGASDLARMIHPEWDNPVNTNIDPPAPAGGSGLSYGASRSIAFVPGGIVQCPYDATNQFRAVMTSCVPGLVAVALGKIAVSKSGKGTLTIHGGTDRDCAGLFSVSTAAGVFVGDGTFLVERGNGADFSFCVGDPVPGMALLPFDTDLFINMRFDRVFSDVLIEVAGHNRY